MEIFKEYILQNWILILILLAFTFSLITTVFLQRKTILRTYILIIAIFLLSIVVFFEFQLKGKGEYRILRSIFTAIRYSSTPLLIAQITFTLVKKMKWFVYIPALALVVLNIISIPTGIVFKVDENANMSHGPIWFIPYIVAGLYGVFLIYFLIKRSNKRLTEILPISFFAIAIGSGLILPFFLKEQYASVFCSTMAIGLFAYYCFNILSLTKKDSLTGLLNRQAYYSDISQDQKSISALISIDVNGLKAVNDNVGHLAGDEALITLALCFKNALRLRQNGYRIGGDEFVIICRKNNEQQILELVERIRKNIEETEYSCSIGYSLNLVGDKPIEMMFKEADQMVYIEKEKFYEETGNERRRVK